MSPPDPTAVSLASASGARKPLAVWLAGGIAWDDYLAMSERLAGEVAGPHGRNPTLVICELEPCITIGRLGSRGDVRLSDDDLRSRRLRVRFTGRGGGAVLHGPGQVVVAAFAALEDLGLGPHEVGCYVARIQASLVRAIRGVRCGSAVEHPGMHGVFGRTGLLAAVGIAVRRGVACHGAFVNVSPALDLHHRIDTVPPRLRPGRSAAAEEPTPPAAGSSTMGSIEADVQRRVRLQDLRTAVVQQYADAFAFPRTHINAGFPHTIRHHAPSQPEVVNRVG
jgi:lipoyl(octanoyl) transferase